MPRTGQRLLENKWGTIGKRGEGAESQFHPFVLDLGVEKHQSQLGAVGMDTEHFILKNFKKEKSWRNNIANNHMPSIQIQIQKTFTVFHICLKLDAIFVLQGCDPFSLLRVDVLETLLLVFRM